jgi:hypothetical protein
MEDHKTVSTGEVEELAVLKNTTTLRHCSEVFEKNQLQSQLKLNEGNALVKTIGEMGMDSDRCSASKIYIKECAALRDEMYGHRSDITRLLTAVQRRFTSLENAINPTMEESPAFILTKSVGDFEFQRIMKAREREKQLLYENEKAQNDILNNNELTEEQKNDALSRLKNKLISNQLELKKITLKTKWEPQVIDKCGYLEIMNYWWNECGQHMTEKDLDKALYTMLMFARKQAAKGLFIKSEFVDYKEIPCIK